MSAVDNILELYTFKSQLGEAIEWTGGQKDIMSVIVNLGVDGKRLVQVETPTQYGRLFLESDNVSLCHRRVHLPLVSLVSSFG